MGYDVEMGENGDHGERGFLLSTGIERSFFIVSESFSNTNLEAVYQLDGTVLKGVNILLVRLGVMGTSDEMNQARRTAR